MIANQLLPVIDQQYTFLGEMMKNRFRHDIQRHIEQCMMQPPTNVVHFTTEQLLLKEKEGEDSEKDVIRTHFVKSSGLQESDFLEIGKLKGM